MSYEMLLQGRRMTNVTGLIAGKVYQEALERITMKKAPTPLDLAMDNSIADIDAKFLDLDVVIVVSSFHSGSDDSHIGDLWTPGESSECDWQLFDANDGSLITIGSHTVHRKVCDIVELYLSKDYK
jgi:hypothetical protein